MASIKSIVENLPDSKVKAIGYRVPEDTHFSVTGPKTYLRAFGMMVDVLAGIEAVMAVEEGPSDKIPNVDNKLKRGTTAHANEVCATLEQVSDDIFATHDNGVTFIAIGEEADEFALSNLLA